MANLKENPTLKDLQKYNAETMKERGFADEALVDRLLLLGEEVGELFQAARKYTNIKISDTKKLSPIDEEIADVFILTLSIANKLDIDLETALRKKEEKNNKRTWV